MRSTTLPLAALALGLGLGLTLAACGSDDATTTDPAVTGTEATPPEEPAVTGTAATPPEESVETGTAATPPEESVEELYPDVVGVEASKGDDGTWTFNVTLSSPYDSPERYADAWRVVGPDGTVYGERILTHDHAGEQPFTRSQSGIAIPDDVTEVVVEGRDQVSGWGGETVTYTLPR